MSESVTSRGRRHRALPAVLGVALVFFFALLPIVLGNYDAVEMASPPAPERFHTRAGYDHTLYHMPVIREFRGQWPSVDLKDYASATTPGYHLVMAAVLRAWDDERAVRGVSVLIGAMLAGLMVFALARERGVKWGVVRALPLVCSVYVISSAAWALPDNAAWLLVLAITLIALMPRLRLGALALAGACLVMLVLVRQVHLWAAGMVWWAWWLGESRSTDGDDAHPVWMPSHGDPLKRKFVRTMIAFAATMPAIGVVLWFRNMWGGMTPPTFADRLAGPNLVVPATILSVLAVFGGFFVGDWIPGAWSALRERTGARWAVALSVPIGLVLGLVPESSYRHEDRISHIWNVVRRLPTIGDRSPVIVLGSVAGAVMAAMIFNALGRRDRWVMLAVLGGFIASQTAGALAWPRYYEPLVLMWVALACARMDRVDAHGMFAPVRWAHAMRMPMVVLLIVLQVVVTVASLKP